MHPTHPAPVAALYDAVLAQGQPAMERFYDCLRGHGIEPTKQVAGELFVSNPVLVAGSLVEQMTEDLNRFVTARREALRDARDLLATMPDEVREGFASEEVATALWEQLQVEPPLASLDAFLVETPEGLQPRYVEWQTVGAYATMGCWVSRCALAAWPSLADASPTATRGWSIETLEARLRALYLAGIEEDARQGVILDYHPYEQKSRREFFAIQALTGGAARGWGILDPREVLYHTPSGSSHPRPHYRRDGQLIPIRRAYARLVHSDIVGRLLPACTAAERRDMQRLFGDAAITWVNHPLHFYYGTKADFDPFFQAGLSPYLPPTRLVTEELLQEIQQGNGKRLAGQVYKPTLGSSGQAVELEPWPAQVERGGLLQARFHPAACHPTLFGPRVPEIRVMGIPDGNRLTGAAIYNRVMPPDSFKSNAGVVATQGVPGTGEGFGFVLW